MAAVATTTERDAATAAVANHTTAAGHMAAADRIVPVAHTAVAVHIAVAIRMAVIQTVVDRAMQAVVVVHAAAEAAVS
jgi:hypothetical protein